MNMQAKQVNAEGGAYGGAAGVREALVALERERRVAELRDHLRGELRDGERDHRVVAAVTVEDRRQLVHCRQLQVQELYEYMCTNQHTKLRTRLLYVIKEERYLQSGFAR